MHSSHGLDVHLRIPVRIKPGDEREDSGDESGGKMRRKKAISVGSNTSPTGVSIMVRSRGCGVRGGVRGEGVRGVGCGGIIHNL